MIESSSTLASRLLGHLARLQRGDARVVSNCMSSERTEMIDFDTALPGFDPFVIRHQGLEMAYNVFGGGSGPAVILLHEIDGFKQPVKDLANHLAADGFSVYAPAFFSDLLGGLLVCVRREFVCLSRGRTSPISHWIGALGEEIRKLENERSAVGVIGMCFSGSFALATVIVSDAVKAAVVAQPAMPWASPPALFSDARKRDLGLGEEDRRLLEFKLKEGDVNVLPLRYEKDSRCPRLRVEEISSIDGATPVHYVNGAGHATLTAPFRDQGSKGSMEAVEAAAGWLRERIAAS